MNLAEVHGRQDISDKPMEPIHLNKVKELEELMGPDINSDKGKALAKLNGFNYGVWLEKSCTMPISYVTPILALLLHSSLDSIRARCNAIKTLRNVV